MKVVKTKVSVAASMGSALVLTAGQFFASGATISVSSGFVSNLPTTTADISAIHRSSLSLGTAFHRTWNADANIRFKELARKEVSGDLTPAEWAELDALSDVRRQAKFPLKADQILWQRKQAAATEKLLAALKEYVELHKYPES